MAINGSFLDLVDLVDPGVRGAGVWRGSPAPERSGRTYGGQFLAQALAAAYRTVEAGRRIHSLHAYFVAGGNVDSATDYAVSTVRDGRSFSLRSITASQGKRELFVMVASFQVPEVGFAYQAPPNISRAGFASMSDIPDPADVGLDYSQFGFAHPDLDAAHWSGHLRPVEIRYVNPPPQPLASGGGPQTPITEPQLTWQRLVAHPVVEQPGTGGALDHERGQAGTVGTNRLGHPPAGRWLPDDPVIHDCGLVYLSDSTLVDHILLPHGYRWQDPRLVGTSLDHAMWFSGDRTARADDWLLFEQEVVATGGARGVATGRISTAGGKLVATCTQEGLMRWIETIA